MNDFTRYDHDTYMLPFFEGDTVYNETIMFVGENDSAPLLYFPDEIISVRSSDLETEYVPGKDYEVTDGKISLLPGTSVPFFKRDEYYLNDKLDGHCFGCTLDGINYIYFSEGSNIFNKQVHVTYRHSDRWNGFRAPVSKKFSRILEKMKNGEAVKMLVFGDSICTGCNSSSFTKCAPFADPWFEMVRKSFVKRFQNENITLVNTSVGGKETNWAQNELQTRAIDVCPDLMILGFGMNDGNVNRKPSDEFCSNIKKIIDRFLFACPDTDIAVISTTLPNKEVSGFFGYQDQYEEGLYRLTRDYEHVDVIPMTSVHRALLERKRFYDMTGNNVNHPNDFLARAYAQTVIKTFLG